MKRAEGLKQEIISLSITFVIFLVTFPKFVPDYGIGLDPSYVWALNYLFKYDYNALINLIYPIGPLGFLKYTTAYENYLLAGLLFFSLVKLCFIYLLLQLSNLQKGSLKLSSFLLVLVVAYFSGIDFSIIGSTIVLLLFSIKKPNKYLYFILANLFAFTGLCIKSSIGIAAYSSIFTFLVFILLIRQFDYKKLGALIFISAAVFISGGAIVFQGLGSFIQFLIGLTHLAGGYASGLALFPENNWWLLGAFILTISAFPFFIKKRYERIAFLLLLLPLFAMWKHAMGREDVSHIFVLPTFLFVFWGVVFLFSDKLKAWYFIFPILSIYFFDANIRSANLHHEYNISLNGVSNFNEAILNYTSFNEKYKAISKKNISVNQLDNSMLAQIGEGTVDVYPWDLSFVPANNLNWQPRKTLELGAANSQWLSNKNALCFDKKTGPGFVLLHLNKDKWGGSLGTLDGRYLLNDEPLIVFKFLKNYNLESKTERLLLLQKSHSELNSNTFKKETAEWDSWVKVPEKDRLLRVKFLSDRTFILRLKSFLFKDESYFIDYRLKDGRVLSYRFIASNAADGLWVSPLVLNPENNKPSLIVKEIRFRSTNTNLMADNIFLEWENINLSVDEFFNKNNSATEKYLLRTQENYDSVQNDELNINKENSFSGKYSKEIPAGSYSSTTKISLDTLWKNGISQLTVEANFMYFMSQSESNNAVLVISVQNSEADFWKSFTLSAKKNPDEWAYAFLSEKLNLQNHKTGLLSIYVWNKGSDNVCIDNFSKSIWYE